MITIYEKDINEIHNELGQILLNEEKRNICLTYILELDGTRINTDDLTEKEIISLIKHDLMDYKAPEGSYKKHPRELDSLRLAHLVRDKMMPTVNGAYELYRLIPKYEEIIPRIFNGFGYMNIVHRAVIIANYLKESHNDFSAISYDEMITVLEQMANNEFERNYNLQRRLK